MFRAVILVILFHASLRAADTSPHVWIFNGIPGDDPHLAFFEKNIAKLKKTLISRYQVREENVRVYFGSANAGYSGICSRENMLAACNDITQLTKAEPEAPVWIILLGHANKYAGGSMFNIPGPDISAREIGTALADTDPRSPMTVFITTTAAEPFMKHLAHPNRIVCTASRTADDECETEYPTAFLDALESEDSDVNQDGKLSLLELHLATRARVLQIYEKGRFMVKETSLLDGDSDGRGTQRPSIIDSEPAAQRFLNRTKATFQ
jgi:hypothetical protein